MDCLSRACVVGLVMCGGRVALGLGPVCPKRLPGLMAMLLLGLSFEGRSTRQSEQWTAESRIARGAILAIERECDVLRVACPPLVCLATA